jgi:hypothetical protein
MVSNRSTTGSSRRLTLSRVGVQLRAIVESNVLVTLSLKFSTGGKLLPAMKVVGRQL